jgi:hypothetical protein
MITEHPYAGDPVLISRAAAVLLLGVGERTFDRLCWEGRFENMVCEGSRASRELYRSAELRAYLHRGKKTDRAKSLTNVNECPAVSAELRVTEKPKIVAGARKALPCTPGPETRNGTVCEGCGQVFSARRYGMRFCSTTCRVAAHRKDAAA